MSSAWLCMGIWARLGNVHLPYIARRRPLYSTTGKFHRKYPLRVLIYSPFSSLIVTVRRNRELAKVVTIYGAMKEGGIWSLCM